MLPPVSVSSFAQSKTMLIAPSPGTFPLLRTAITCLHCAVRAFGQVELPRVYLPYLSILTVSKTGQSANYSITGTYIFYSISLEKSTFAEFFLEKHRKYKQKAKIG